jgi:hypothetical protein
MFPVRTGQLNSSQHMRSGRVRMRMSHSVRSPILELP